MAAIDTWLFHYHGAGRNIYQFSYLFGGTFKQIEEDWSEWLDKFESLLRSMIWLRVKLILETGYYGEYIYTWVATDEAIKAFDQEFPERVHDWIFSGGPRTFGS